MATDFLFRDRLADAVKWARQAPAAKADRKKKWRDWPARPVLSAKQFIDSLE